VSERGIGVCGKGRTVSAVFWGDWLCFFPAVVLGYWVRRGLSDELMRLPLLLPPGCSSIASNRAGFAGSVFCLQKNNSECTLDSGPPLLLCMKNYKAAVMTYDPNELTAAERLWALV